MPVPQRYFSFGSRGSSHLRKAKPASSPKAYISCSNSAKRAAPPWRPRSADCRQLNGPASPECSDAIPFRRFGCQPSSSGYPQEGNTDPCRRRSVDRETEHTRKSACEATDTVPPASCHSEKPRRSSDKSNPRRLQQSVSPNNTARSEEHTS